ncbi:uncharacterized protein LOC134682071 [Mytilus trossulus]|uniref:uncharacterized protein LOC134682071 n=1 Tax=Mytilus trossulus TaxID=6551 RepID=UPI003003C96C
MSSKLTVCGVCEYRNITKPSVVWCSECDEGLCEECKEHHAASKGSREHSIVPISEYQQLPSNILEITQSCQKHNEKYVIFCKKHDCPCCRRCVVETHDDCKELNAIDDVIRNVKSSSAFLEMEHMLAELSENLQRIKIDRQNNIKSLQENKTKIESEIQQIRVLINNHLDNLQASLIRELYAAEETENKKISCLISSIQEKEREISEYQTNLVKIKQHASDLQTFLAMKHIQQDVIKNEQFLESMLKEKNTNNVIISFETENTFETLPTALNKMGTIILDTRSSDVTLTSRKNKEAQIMVPNTHVATIDDIKLTLKQTMKTIGRDITDLSLLPDGRMILTNYYGQINVMKTDGSLGFRLKTGFCTSQIHYIEDSQKLVVTSGSDKSITIIDMKTRKTEKSIKVGSWIFGIVHRDVKLFFNGCSSGLCVLNLDDDSVTHLVNTTLSKYSSIEIWSDQLYYINDDDSVTCCDLQGKLKWKSEIAAFLRGARGITVDNNGRVYVSGYLSYNVVVISPDGNKHRILLSEKDGLKQPQALFFDRKNNKLLIANQTNKAFLYDVSNY